MAFFTTKENVSNIAAKLIIIFAVIAGLYFAQDFLIPVSIAALIALLLMPVVDWLIHKGLPKGLSITLAVTAFILLIAGIGTLIASQINSFSAQFTTITQNVIEQVDVVQEYVTEHFNIGAAQQQTWLKNQLSSLGGGEVSKVLGGLTSFLTNMVLIMVYAVLFLAYNKKIYHFVVKITRDTKEKQAKSIMRQTQSLVQHYLFGLFIVILILAGAYAIGLFALTIPNAILIGAIAGLFTIIPTIGTLFGGLFAILMALLTKDSMRYPIGVAILFVFIQAIENYILTPNIVGSKVSLNPMVSILGLIAGGLFWGMAGLFMIIPVLGVVKIICDHIESLKPVGYLLGNENE